ncbi:META domain-containing protein [Flavobacterium sp. RHBU_24]|uniref:META domain-containing protein n=1 Tax=Flavobacterium sp. RHBU_24 TaxID=3391185 RepID=UPI0039851109
MKKLFTIFSIISICTLAASCGSTKGGTAAELLTAGNWQLERINGKAISESDFANGVPVANFSSDYKITGNSGCNRYGGSYNLNDEGGMNISQVISTKMFCDGVPGEARYLEALDKVNTAKIDADRLTLYHDTEEVLVYKKTE